MMMAPRLVDKIENASGRVVATPDSEEIGRPLSPQTASTLTGIMQRVVDEGTGTAQTGRKDSAGRPLSDAWFVAFAPVSSPKVAIAVVIEDSTGYGGTVAAPVARDILNELR